MFDDKAFDEIVASKGIKFSAIAKRLGIADSSLRNKRKGKSEFTQTQISEFCSFLGLSNDERNRIFFAE